MSGDNEIQQGNHVPGQFVEQPSNYTEPAQTEYLPI